MIFALNGCSSLVDLFLFEGVLPTTSLAPPVLASCVAKLRSCDEKVRITL